MLIVITWAVIIGAVFAVVGYLIMPELVVLGPAAFVVSLLFLDKVAKES